MASSRGVLVPFLAVSHNTRALRRFRLLLFLYFVVSLLPASAVAQQRPLVTQEAEVLPSGELLLQVGFEFLQGARFPLSGLEGDLTRLGVVGLHLGVSPRVELQIEGTVRNFLAVAQQQPAFITPVLKNGTSTDDFGDFTLAGKIALVPEQGRRPAIGFRFGFEMPTTDERRGIGLNTTNVFGTLHLQKHFGRLNMFGHVGAGILEAPAGLFAQNDVWLLGWAWVFQVTRQVNIVGEVQGRISARNTAPPSALVGTGSHGESRLGIQVFAGGFRWDWAGIVGLGTNDADTGFTFGVSKTFVFGRKQ